MSALDVTVDEFIAKRAKHRTAQAEEQRTYYVAQAAKEKIFRHMNLNPYNREHLALVGKTIREREKELAKTDD